MPSSAPADAPVSRNTGARPTRPKRGDIQGLRALAVLLVVVYHLWPKKLTGGFIGVDVFFVISGYLITAHLVSEVTRTGTVSLTRFWARRIRRLLPAAFLVLAASVLIAYVVLPSSMRVQNLTEIGAAALYGLNWVLAANAVDYLAADNAPSLVQHYWSLSVEEQFYIVWPVLILLALVVARLLRLRNQRAVIGGALFVVFVASLAFSVWLTATNPGAAYFVTPTRAWEFAAGGLLAFFPVFARTGGVFHATLSWLALGMIGASAWFFDAETPFPSGTALLPVIGTAALIWLGDSTHHWSPQYIAGHSAVQLIGDASYAIYLWHWPLIIAFPYLTAKAISVPWGLAILALTIALALVTQRFVETPLRSSTGLLRQRRNAYGLMAAGMVVVVSVAAGGSYLVTTGQAEIKDKIRAAMQDTSGCYGAYALANDCANPYGQTDLTSPTFAVTDKDSWGRNDPGAKACIRTEPTPGYPARDCTFSEGDITIALIGDSHSGHLLEPLKIAAAENGWKLRTFILGGCSTFEDQYTLDKVRDAQADLRTEGCMGWTEHVYSTLFAEHPDAVLFSSRSWHRPLDADTIADRLSQIEAAGIQPIILEDVPGMPKGVTGAACIETLIPCDTSVKERTDPVLVGAEKAKTTTVSINDLLCTETDCPPVIGGAVVYADDNHLARSFAYTLAPVLSERIDEALAPASSEAIQ